MIRRIIAGLGLSTGTIMVLTIGQIVSVPVYLLRWGVQVYGEWLTLTGVVASLSVLNLGVQTYVINNLIGCHVRNEREEGRRILHSALLLYTILCSLSFAVTVVFVSWPGILTWLKIVSIPPLDARLILGIQGVLVTYSLVNGLLVNLFRVNNQLPRQLTYRLLEQSVYSFAPVLIAVLGGYPIHASLVTLLLLAGIGVFAIRDVWLRSPFPLGLSDASWRSAWALIGPSLTFFAVSISTTILSTGMIVIISTTIGAIAVALFSTTLALSNFVRTIIHQGLGVLWPEITATAAFPADPGRLARWHRLTLKLVGALVLVAGVGIGLLGPEILAIWTRGRITVDPLLNLLLVAYLVIHAPAIASGVFGLATNRQWEVFKVQIVISFISISLCASIVPIFGIRAAALGLIVGQAIGTVWTMRLACSWTSDRWPELSKDSFIRPLPSAIIIVFASLAVWYVLPSPSGKVIGTVGVILITILISWGTWYTRYEKDILSHTLKEAFLRPSHQVRTQAISR